MKNIWPAEPDDFEDICRIYKEGIDTGTATFQTECPSYEEWDSSHLDFCRLVYAENQKILGWVALSPVSGRCAYKGVAEVSIYIGKDSRGKGVGTKLLGAAIAEAEENGIWTLQSTILENNPASIALHEKCGFRMVGFREKIARDRFGVWRNSVFMERRSGLEKFR